jgi:SAM-dependent methyltransferase
MSDTTARFSNRVDNYVKFRPGYPPGVMDILRTNCGLTATSIVADVGSGTGILSELFLKNGNTVFGIEPNAPMREAAEHLLKEFPNFASIDATAEATTLETSSVDLITAAQAFHWFDRDKARTEFARILRPGGWVALIWNERRLDSTAFLRDYEKLLLRFGTDYEKVRHENVAGELGRFFAPADFRIKSLDNVQHFDFESLKGRTRSASYTPEPGDPNFAPLFVKLEELFNTHQSGGKVDFEYDTRVYYGRLKKPVVADDRM